MGIELSIENVTKTFGKITAVNNFSFSVNPGELFALLGPSGAGKSTTINLIGGIENPDSGDIKVQGESVVAVKPQERDFSMVFESYALYPHFTVFENMSFPLRAPIRADKYTEEAIKKKVEETAKILEIHELLHRYPKELSGGQKQRVGLGRALVRDAELFLLDEPIAHLDAKLRHHMRGELKKLQKNFGRTTVLATPDYNEVVAMADRAAIINEGNIEQIGTPIELFNQPANKIVANAIGDPPINLLECKFETKGGASFLDGDGFSIKCNQKLVSSIKSGSTDEEIILGIRPSEIDIYHDPEKGLIPGEVYVFEPLGGEAVATLSVDGKLVKVLCSWSSNLKIGDKVSMDFDLEAIHIFEKKSGKALYA